MSELIIAVYANPRDAFAAGQGLAVLQREAGTEPEDIVVVTRNTEGRVSVNQSVQKDSGRPLGGGSWGALIGMLFLDGRDPIEAGTGLAAQFHAAGLDADFLQTVYRALGPGAAAVGLRVRLLGADRVEKRIRSLPGNPKILRQRLSADAEESLYDLQEQIPESLLHRPAPDGLI